MLTKIKSLSLYLMVIAIFIGGMVALLLYLRPNPEQVKLAVTDFFNDSTGCYIEMDSIRPDGMLLPAIRMSGLRLYANDGSEVAKVRWLQADLSVSDLLAGGVGISHIHLVEPTMQFAAFEECLNKLHLPSRQVAGQAAQVSVMLEKGTVLWPDNPLPEMQEISFPSLDGQWDGTKNLKLYGYVQSLTAIEGHTGTLPVHLSMRTGEQAVDRFSFDFLASTDGPLVNARKLSTYIIRPQKQTGHFSLNIPQASWLSFLSDTPFADEALKLEADLNFAADGIGFENLEGQIGDESFQGQMNMYIQAGAASYLDANFNFGVLDKNVALSFAGLNQSVAGFSNLASKLALAPFEIDLGVTASGLAAADGEMARAPNIHMIAGLGSVTVDQFNLGLPGGTEVSLLADFMPDPSGENAWFASGGVSLQSSNLRRSLTWLGHDITTIAPDLLRQFSLTTNFEAEAGRFSLNDLDIRLDQSSATGLLEYDNKDQVTPASLNVSMDAQRLQLDGYSSRDWGLGELAGNVEFVKSMGMNLEIDLGFEELIANEIKHENVTVDLNKDQNGFDLAVENYAPMAQSNLDFYTAVDWSNDQPSISYEGLYKAFALDELFTISKADLDMLIGEDGAQELILSFSGKGNVSQLKNEFSGDLGSISFAGQGDLSLAANEINLDISQLNANRDEVEFSDLQGRLSYNLNGESRVEGLTGKIGSGLFALDYNSVEKQSFNVTLRDICDAMLNYKLKDWIAGNFCIAEGKISGDLSEGLMIDGTFSGPLNVEILVDQSEMPAGIAENLAGNILTYLPEETTRFESGISYKNDQLEFNQITVESKQVSGQGRAAYNRLTERLNLDMIFHQDGLDQDAIDLQVNGPVDGLNLRIKGNWLKEIR